AKARKWATGNRPWANRRAVPLTENAFNKPLPGAAVSFTAPASGASGSFSNSTASISGTTDANGQVSEAFTANTQAGSYTVTAADAGSDSVSFSLTNDPGPASKLVFGVQPSTTTAGNAISPAVTVKVEDQYGNVVTSDSSNVTIGSSTTAFTTSSTLTVAAKSGVATFSNIDPTTAGTSNTLSASDGSLTGATSNPFTANPTAPSKLPFTVQPPTTTP